MESLGRPGSCMELSIAAFMLSWGLLLVAAYASVFASPYPAPRSGHQAICGEQVQSQILRIPNIWTSALG